MIIDPYFVAFVSVQKCKTPTCGRGFHVWSMMLFTVLYKVARSAQRDLASRSVGMCAASAFGPFDGGVVMPVASMVEIFFQVVQMVMIINGCVAQYHPFLCTMCYSTTLDRDLKALEKTMNKRLITELKRIDLPYQTELPLGQTTAFARPAWPVVTSADPERISILRWGLLPRFITTEEEAKDFLRKAPTFNAISEEVATKRTFKQAFEKGQRCLIPVTAFHEWQHQGKQKVPYSISLRDTEIFCLGGLWEHSAGMDTYTVLTTAANPLMARIHNTKQRQPVIIPAEHWEAWLSPDLDPEQVTALCKAIPEESMVAVAKELPAQGSLF